MKRIASIFLLFLTFCSISKAQIYTSLYTGRSNGPYTSLNVAVTQSCASGNPWQVDIPQGATYTGTISAITNGCQAVPILDQSVTPNVFYIWTVLNGKGSYVPGTNPDEAITGINVATANGLQGSASSGGIVSLTIGPDPYHLIPVANGSASLFLNQAGQYTSLENQGGVVESPTTSQLITQPLNTYFGVNGSVNNTFSTTTLNSSQTIPNSGLIPYNVAFSWPYEFVTAGGTSPSYIYVYNISSGTQVKVGSGYTTGCVFPVGLNTAKISDYGNILLMDCSDTGTLQTYTINSNGTLSSLGSLSGLNSAQATIVVDGNEVFIPLLGSAGSVTGSVAEINISNPSAPSLVTTTTLSMNYSNPVQISLNGGYLYVLNQNTYSSSNIQVINESTMALVGSPFDLPYFPKYFTVSGNKAFVTFGSVSYLETINISNPTSLSEINSTSLSGCLPGPISIEGRYAYVGCQNNILKLDISNVSDIITDGTYSTFNSPSNMGKYGRYIFITSAIGGGNVYMLDTGGEYDQQLTSTDASFDYLSAQHLLAGDEIVSNNLLVQGEAKLGLNSTVNGQLILTNILAPSGSWPTWLVPTITNNNTLSVTASTIPISAGGTGNTTGQPSGNAGGDLSGSYPNPILSNTSTARGDLGLANNTTINDLAYFNNTTGQTSDSGIAYGNVVTLSGTQTLTNKTINGGTVNPSVLTLNGNAPSGHVLVGNGTSYVDAAGYSPAFTLSDVTSSHSLNTEYQNTNGSPIIIYVTAYISGSYSQGSAISCYAGSISGEETFISVGSVHNDQGLFTVNCIIPNNYYYKVIPDGTNVSNFQTPNLRNWIQGIF